MSDTSRRKRLKWYFDLLSLAKHPDTPPEEAKSALLKAQELYAKHQFTPEELDDVNVGEKNVLIDARVDEMEASRYMDVQLMAKYVALAFKSTFYRSVNRGLLRQTDWAQIHFIGFKADVFMAKEFYDTCKVVMDNMADAFVKRKREEGMEVSELSPLRDSFRSGFVQGVGVGLKSQIQELGLMVMPPQEAIEALQQITNSPYSWSEEAKVELKKTSQEGVTQGFKDGKAFASGSRQVGQAEAKKLGE